MGEKKKFDSIRNYTDEEISLALFSCDPNATGRLYIF